MPELDSQKKWNGWGWQDTHFYMDKDMKMRFVGNRYALNGKMWPDLAAYSFKTTGTQFSPEWIRHAKDKLEFIPEPVRNEKLIEFVEKNSISHSLDEMHRAHRSHGNSLDDITQLRAGKCRKRIPDIVVWPKCHDEVVQMVNAANSLNCAIIPYGGGTNVSNALSCPENEPRCIISMDMCQMNKILKIDESNLVCLVQSGIVGEELERQLDEKGFTVGHAPDSIEFSTVGGWVSTRASGMKRNKYGNIEDIMVDLKVVTPAGVLGKSSVTPRSSAGPDIYQFVLGSEGILGVITEVSLKICPRPCRRYGAYLFPDLVSSVSFLREVAKQRCAPATLRLVDNDQYKAAQGLTMERETLYQKIYHFMTWKVVVPYWYRFSPDKYCAASICYEGSKEEIAAQESRLNKIANSFNGVVGDVEQGYRGDQITYYIAYLRDLGLNYSILGESFETSITWDKVLPLIQDVKEFCRAEGKRLGLILPIHISSRVTQIYDSGACVYFYLAFNYRKMFPELDECEKLEAAKKIYSEIETAARMKIMSHGGSISHHHGVGKSRKRFLPEAIGAVGLSALQAIKQNLDPNNVFCCANLFDVAKI